MVKSVFEEQINKEVAHQRLRLDFTVNPKTSEFSFSALSTLPVLFFTSYICKRQL
jgi:hypothetical protein